ncbi:DUF2642 domain-containing protein [Bacillus sp. OAE603]|uniref:DUF2642 domain-containing protein n=1 Tax=Gottfriedia sp. OAE603 TaxID=2663872 RepID=UPI00178B1FB2
MGDKPFEGILTDEGQNIIVLFNGQDYYYISLSHVHKLGIDRMSNEKIANPNVDTFMKDSEDISLRTVLSNVKRNYVEIKVKRNLTFHGYILQVLNDYLVFYSPLFKTMYISLAHIKWVRLYNQERNPYNLSNETFPFKPINGSVELTLREQLELIQGTIIVIDGGIDTLKIGLLKKVDDNMVEIVQANGEISLIGLVHIKSVHVI